MSLRVIKHKDPQSPWTVNWLAPYLERQIKALIPSAEIEMAINHDTTVERQVRRGRTIQKMLGSDVFLLHRCDGKPELINGKNISVSHAGELTLAVVSSNAIGCDVEPVVSRTAEVWLDLLGTSKFALANVIAQEQKEGLDITAPRVWAANECLKKAGMILDVALTLLTFAEDGSVCLVSGNSVIATFVVSVQEFEQLLAIAVLVQGEGRREKRLEPLNYQIVGEGV